MQDMEIVVSKSSEIDKSTDPRWSALTYEKDEHGRIWTYDERSKLICGAKTRNGGPCRKPPLTSRNRCRLHGGKSLRGAEHPNAKHLRYSNDVVGKHLFVRYEQAANDPELLEMRDDIAITEAYIGQLLGEIESGESLKAWQNMSKAYDAFITANKKGDTEEAIEHIQEIGRLIKFGLGKHAKWQEIQQAQTHKRKLTEAQHKRENDMQQRMTSEQAKNLLVFVVSTVKRRIYEFFPNDKGRELMSAISADISSEMAQRPTKPSRKKVDSEDI